MVNVFYYLSISFFQTNTYCIKQSKTLWFEKANAFIGMHKTIDTQIFL